MKFLLPHITDRKTTSNLSDISDSEDNDGSRMSEGTFQSSDSQSLFEPSQTTPTFEPAPSTSASEVHQSRAASPATNLIARPTTKRKRTPYPQQRGQNASMDDKIIDAILSLNKPHVEEKDDCDNFLQSLAPQLRSLNPLARYKCQAEIQLLILRHLEHSQTSSASSQAVGQNQQPLQQQYNAAYDPYQ